jgi:hypothetical protein
MTIGQRCGLRKRASSRRDGSRGTMHAEYAYLVNSRQMACSRGGWTQVLGGGCWLWVLGEGCSLEHGIIKQHAARQGHDRRCRAR